jgi:hypothetical protein
MNPARGSPKLKETPKTIPELLPAWEKFYEEVIAVYPKSKAVGIMTDRHGVKRETVMAYLLPQYR